MIEQIQSWLHQVVQWLGATPRAWLLGGGLALFTALLLAGIGAALRARRRATTGTRGDLPTTATPPAETGTRVAPAVTAASQSLAVAPEPAAAIMAPLAPLVDPAPVAAEHGGAAHAANAGGTASTYFPVGGVAVAERPEAPASRHAAGEADAEEAYRQARALLAQPLGGETLRTAVALLRRAQEVWTRETAPERWAALQNEIGSAYQEMSSGDRAANLNAAIAHHESALEVFDPVRHALSWAWTQSALAAAYQSLPVGSIITNARAAVAYHQRALDVLTPENAPLGWAWNQNNLGAAFELMRGVSDGDRVRALQDAHTCYAAALRVYTPVRYPVQHQIVTQNLLRVQDELRAIE